MRLSGTLALTVIRFEATLGLRARSMSSTFPAGRCTIMVPDASGVIVTT